MYRALLVCNSRYPKDPSELPELKGPKADGLVLRDALTDPSAGLFDRSEVRLLSEADSGEILDSAEEFFGGAEADDVLLFYYSGHGQSLSRELYLCAGNTRTQRLESSAVASSSLSRMIKRSFAQVKIVVLDCCHSGGFKGGHLIEGLSGTGRFVIAATSVADQAGDAQARGEPSPFTAALVEGLLSEALDRDGDGAVDLDDVFTHLSGTRFNGHAPHRKFDGAGAVPIARRPTTAGADGPATSAGQKSAVLHEPLPHPDGSVSPHDRSAPEPNTADLLESVVPQAVLDQARVQAFRDELREDVADAYPRQLTTSEFLVRSGLVKDGKPTLSGALLFGENPTAVLPTAMVRCVRFGGADKTDPTTTTELYGTLPELIVQARDFVASAALLGELPTNEAAHAEALYRFPMIAVRELIANAVVHRDYTRGDACVMVHIYDDRVEVISPGAWGARDQRVPDGQQRLGALERQSQPRNFRLARVLSWAKLVESVGAGLPRSVADCRTVGAPEPVVRIRDGMVTVTVFPLVHRSPEPARTPRVATTERTDPKVRSHGIDPHRIAMVISKFADSRYPVASGYRVTNDMVLTAAHAVADAQDCRVRFPVGSSTWEAPANVVAVHTAADIAVLRFQPHADAEVVPPVRFGRVSSQPAVLQVETVGFPRFQRLTGGRRSVQDVSHERGTTSTLTDALSGTLRIDLTSVQPESRPGDSAWIGMSGAPVWVDGLLVGVVIAAQPSRGQSSLLAARIERSLADADLGLPSLLGLPEPLDLPEVPAPELRPLAPYLAHAQDISPPQLTGRDAELAALTEFCRSDRAYAVVRGQPWSGKTALAAWFTLHLPQDVDAVSFFVTSRLAGQDDGTAFTEAMVDQLSWYLAHDRPSAATLTGALDRLRRELLAAAAHKAHHERRQLLLVVDGIDEDRGPSSGLPSIASLLPMNPPSGLHVLVTGRQMPLPDDVPQRHPLRYCTETLLSPPADTLSARSEAHSEVLTLLSGTEAQRDVLGLVCAADALPFPGLAELLHAAPYELSRMMSGPVGRLLAVADTEAPATGMVSFAHPALQEVVRQLLGRRRMREYEQALEARSRSPWGQPDTPF